jgi:hypothetical protein
MIAIAVSATASNFNCLLPSEKQLDEYSEKGNGMTRQVNEFMPVAE